MSLEAVALQPALEAQIPGLTTGSLLAGRYRLGEALGEGGMCLVFAAVDERLERDVAVKILRPERSSPELVRRFVTEARTLATLDSPHLVAVLDLGAVQGPDGGRLPYMVLERLSGSDLRRFSDERAPLPVSFIVTAVLQATEGVATAHAAGIVHRDLKPENLFVLADAQEGQFIKVLDFGIARLPRKRDGEASLTYEGEQMGSPGYTAPEQLCNARDVDERTDIWSLGVVLYELLGGAPPFTGESPREVCAHILTGRVEPLAKRNPSLDSRLVEIVHRALDSDRRRRFSDVAELARALLPFAEPDGIDQVRRIERRLGLPVTPDPTRGPEFAKRESVSRITPIPRAPVQLRIPDTLEPLPPPPAPETYAPETFALETFAPETHAPEADTEPLDIPMTIEPVTTEEYYPELSYAEEEEEHVPVRRSRVRRAFSYLAFALMIVPLVFLASVAVANLFPSTAAWSERTAEHVRTKAVDLTNRARTAVFGERSEQ
jgi:serine/threonine protein kinase